MASSTTDYFFKKQTFNSYDELNTLVMHYEKCEKQKLFNRSRRALREDDESSEEDRKRLIYKSIRYECKFGKNYHGSKAEVRQTNSFKRDCPFFIQINKPLTEQVLRTSTLNLTHNHPGTEEYIKHIPENRRLDCDQEKIILNLLEMKTNKTSIQKKINEEFDKLLTKKDIHNLAKKLINPEDDTLLAAINTLENDYIISWGNPRGKPILLVHGRQDSAATFIPLLELLPKHFHYVGIDLPGHGKSDPLPIGIALTRFLLVVAIDMVVKDLGWNKFFYIGHSMGSELGLFFNAIYPNLIAKHVLIDPGIALQRNVIENFAQFYSFYDNYYKNYSKLNVDDRIYSKKQAIQAVMRARGMTEEQAEVILSRNLKKIGEDSFKLSWDKRTKHLIPANFPPEYYFELLFKNSPPTLYIHANQSPYIKTKEISDKTIMKLEQESNFKVLKVDGTHDVHFINPKAFSDVLCKFLNNSGVRSKL